MTAILYGILDGILNGIAPSALLPRNDGILEFHRDPPVKLGDDIVGNSRIPSKILEFLKNTP